MTEYIEREAVIHRIRKVATMIGFENPAVAIDSAITVIERAPTEDVAPVRHGRWEARAIPRSDPDGDWIALEYHCSLCNRLEYRKENYCPNCGAKMDLEG